jgi:hypothetical protein
MKNKKLIFGGRGMIAAIVMMMAVTALLPGCGQTAPEKYMDSYWALQDAFSEEEASYIFLPDMEILDEYKFRSTSNVLYLNNQNRKIHIGYRMDICTSPALPHLEYVEISCESLVYAISQSNLQTKPELFIPNMKYAGLPIKYIYSETPAVAMEIAGQMSDETACTIELQYIFDMDGCRYEISMIQEYLFNYNATIDSEIKMANKILFGIAKNIIDKGAYDDRSDYGTISEKPVSEKLDVITKNDLVRLKNAFFDIGMAGTVEKTEILYGYGGNADWLLGSTEDEYLIMYRETSFVADQGRGNPYADAPDGLKYFGGIGCYYVAVGGVFLNLNTNKLDSIVNYAPELYEEAEVFIWE